MAAPATNVLGGPLECCCTDPMTGLTIPVWVPDGAAGWPHETACGNETSFAGIAEIDSAWTRCPLLFPGFYRDGFCRTGGQDFGVHIVCAQVRIHACGP